MEHYLRNWKSAIDSVINEEFERLLSYGDPQGEYELRVEIAKYIYENKYKIITKAIQTYMGNKVKLISSNTWMRVILEIETKLMEEEIIELAKDANIKISPISEYYVAKNNYKDNGKVRVLISYKGIATEDIGEAIKILSESWFMKSKKLDKNKT